MSNYECNGDKGHIAIIYGSQPCPLCACHRRIAEAEELVKELADFISKAAPGGNYWEETLAPRVDEFENQWGKE